MLRKIIRRLYNRKVSFFIISDIFIIIIALYLAFLLRFEGDIPLKYIGIFFSTFYFFVLSKILWFHYLKIYKISWTYAGLPEIIDIAKAHLFNTFILGIILLTFRDTFLGSFPRSVLFIDVILSFLFISGFRLFERSFRIFTKKKILQGERVLIVGAGDAGVQLLRNMSSVKDCGYLPVGFVDDDQEKIGRTIHGISILGNRREIPKLVDRFNIESIIFAIPSSSSDTIKETVEYARQAGIVKIKILPSSSELFDTNIGIKDIKDIEAKDLLGRQEIKIDVKSINSYLANKIILVTGAAGSIGSELCRQIMKYSTKLIILLDQDETGVFNLHNELREKFPHLEAIPLVGNIRDEDKIEAVFSRFKPQVIFHAAAYKHLPMMESFPEEAIKTNIIGTWVVAEAALRHESERFILISTDKAVNPTSVMGVTKRIAELIINQYKQKSKTKFLAVRFGNVLESRGNMFQIFMQEIRERKAVTITHPGMKRYIITISEAVILVLHAAAADEGDIFTLDMGKMVNVVEFAKELIRLCGYEPDKDIPIVFTGIRPGEKMFEEYISTQEDTINTKYSKVFAVKSRPLALESEAFFNYLQKLKELTEGDLSKDKIRQALKEIVPDFSLK
jgi:FlaA1/EpsC-like NDP-sugar epimerase